MVQLSIIFLATKFSRTQSCNNTMSTLPYSFAYSGSRPPRSSATAQPCTRTTALTSRGSTVQPGSAWAPEASIPRPRKPEAPRSSYQEKTASRPSGRASPIPPWHLNDVEVVTGPLTRKPRTRDETTRGTLSSKRVEDLGPSTGGDPRRHEKWARGAQKSAWPGGSLGVVRREKKT
jgi:hypothetical protein